VSLVISSEAPRRYRGLIWSAGLLVLACYIAIAAFHVAYEPMNSDKEFYAASTRAVREGEVPYRDFEFTQPTLITYVNAPVLHFTGFGLFQQRAANGLWGSLAILLAARLIAHRCGTGSGHAADRAVRRVSSMDALHPSWKDLRSHEPVGRAGYNCRDILLLPTLTQIS
jgi:hypothetical protein